MMMDYSQIRQIASHPSGGGGNGRPNRTIVAVFIGVAVLIRVLEYHFER